MGAGGDRILTRKELEAVTSVCNSGAVAVARTALHWIGEAERLRDELKQARMDRHTTEMRLGEKRQEHSKLRSDLAALAERVKALEAKPDGLVCAEHCVDGQPDGHCYPVAGRVDPSCFTPVPTPSPPPEQRCGDCGDWKPHTGSIVGHYCDHHGISGLLGGDKHRRCWLPREEK